MCVTGLIVALLALAVESAPILNNQASQFSHRNFRNSLVPELAYYDSNQRENRGNKYAQDSYRFVPVHRQNYDVDEEVRKIFRQDRDFANYAPMASFEPAPFRAYPGSTNNHVRNNMADFPGPRDFYMRGPNAFNQNPYAYDTMGRQDDFLFDRDPEDFGSKAMGAHGQSYGYNGDMRDLKTEAIASKAAFNGRLSKDFNKKPAQFNGSLRADAVNSERAMEASQFPRQDDGLARSGDDIVIPDIHNRESFDGSKCPTGKIRFLGKCVDKH